MADNAKRPMLLSELYAKQKKIDENVLEGYRNMVKAIMSKEAKVPEDELFINDFLDTVVYLKIERGSKGNSNRSGKDNQTDPEVRSDERAGANPERVLNRDCGNAQNIKLSELVITPIKFDGARHKARRWLDEYERAATSNSWNEATKAKYFQAYLTNSALDWFAVSVTQDIKGDWSKLRQNFCRFYIGRDEDLSLERDLKDSLQSAKESCSAFIARYARLMILADPGVSQAKMVNAIRIRLRPEVVERLASSCLDSVESLNMACASIEDALYATKAAMRLRGQGHQVEERTKKQEARKMKPRTEKRSGDDCFRCGRPGHKKADCFATKNKQGVELKDKPLGKRPQAKQKVSAIHNEDESDEKPEIEVTKRVTAVIVGQATSNSRKRALMKQITLDGKVVQALIDTGSEASIVNAELASLNGWVPSGSKTQLAGANNTPIATFGYIKRDLTITIGTTTKTVRDAKFVVADNLCSEVILGMEMLRWLRVMIDPEEMSIMFKPEAKNIALNGPQELPPRTQLVVEAKAPSGVVGLVQTVPFNFGDPDLLVANSISEVRDGKISCLITNMSQNTKGLKLGQEIASYEHICNDKDDQINAVVGIEDTEAFVTVGENLNDQQVDDLKALLVANKEAFSLKGELGCTELVEHDIELEQGAKPHCEPLRRRPITHKIETKKQVEEMLRQGVIEESQSPWAAAYVLAKKKSGELRLCIDFRKLNEATKKCVFPLPNVDECIDSLAGKRYFSQLDMASGFWQLPLTKRARELTAFRTEEGHYQFRRMPFGLTNAPASFQRLVNTAFSGLKGLDFQIFIDDFCVATADWQEHLVMLDRIFKILIKSNLKLKCNKCSFGMSSVVFLGHEISSEGIRQDPAKMRAIRKMASPQNLKELRTALGMLNYYRKFVPNYAAMSQPLTALTRKGIEFRWSDEQEKSFRGIINKLLENGTLVHFRNEAETALKTDACLKGIGAILLQQDEGKWLIVTCYSRSLKPAEKNYAVTELEALAIVESVGKFRNYLLGRRFKIITDHCALCSVFKNMSTNSRLNRWRLALQEYTFDVIYTKGEMHSDVDCLSRMPLEPNDDFLENLFVIKEKVCAGVTNTLAMPVDIGKWLEEQSQDEECNKNLNQAKNRRNGYKLFKGLLFKNNKLVVPAKKRQEILDNAHGGPIAMHGGVKATLDRLDAFWWPRISLDVASLVENCMKCNLRKDGGQKPMGSYRPISAERPWQLISMDCLELPESLSNRKYVVVAVDVFTRFVIAKAIKSLRMNVARKFLLGLLATFGIPQSILTDNGNFFVNESVKELCAKFSITHELSTPHHHQGNAVAERMIRTIQEKLSIATEQSSAEWELFLPQVVLSINSSVCQTTGFSPFELMLGKRQMFGPGFFQYEKLMEERAADDEMNFREANSRQLIVKEKAKDKYEAIREQVELNIGQRVFVRKPGRLNKLSHRWLGPYEVESKKRGDVYNLVDKERNKRFERHISEMKVCALIILIASSVISEASFRFQRSSPVKWMQTDKFVSPGFIKTRVHLMFASPCQALLKFTAAMQEAQVAEGRCQQIFQNTIGERVAHFGEAPHKPVKVAGGLQGNTVGHQQQQPPQNQVLLPQQQLPLEQQALTRGKRQLASLTTFATLAAVNTVLGRAVDRIWPNQAVRELQMHDEVLREKVKEMIDRLDILDLQAVGVNNILATQASLIQNNAFELAKVRYNHPELMIVSAHIVAQIVELGAQLDRLAISFRMRKPEMGLLVQLVGDDFNLGIEQDSIAPESVRGKSTRPLVLDLEWSARRKDATTNVVQVEAFEVWTNLSEAEPQIIRYQGPRYLIHNVTSNCVKGIGIPKDRWVNARCETENYVDKDLSRWNKQLVGESPFKYQLGTQVKETWQAIYVYCFPHKFTIGNVTEPCPPMVFEVPAEEGFQTSDGYIYAPAAVEFNTGYAFLTRYIDHIHFVNMTVDFNEREAVEKVFELQSKLKTIDKEHYLMHYEGGGVSYFQASLMIIGMLAITSLGFWAWKRNEDEAASRHDELRRMVGEQLYGPTYEPPPRRLPRTNRSPTTINLNMVPTTSAPLPTSRSSSAV